MIITKKNIWEETRKGNLEVLKSDLVDKVKDNWTPLHILAYKEVKDILNHPSVDKVKDNDGWTPLHWLARYGVRETLDHPSVDQVKGNDGRTPLHFLAYRKHITKEDLRKKYPWYNKEIKNIRKAVDEIINTPTSVRFILEDS